MCVIVCDHICLVLLLSCVLWMHTTKHVACYPLKKATKKVNEKKKRQMQCSLSALYAQQHVTRPIPPQSQRLLANACDHIIDSPHEPLNMWRGVLEKEVSHHRITRWLGRLTLRLRRLYISMKRRRGGGCWWLQRPFAWFVSLITRTWRGKVHRKYTIPKPRVYVGLYKRCSTGGLLRYLSKQMSRACEVAIEFELALIHSPLVKWLYDSHASRRLLAEVKDELQKVWEACVGLWCSSPIMAYMCMKHTLQHAFSSSF